MQTNRVESQFVNQQIPNNYINENKRITQQEQKAPHYTKGNPEAFNSANANKVLNQSEVKAEANKLPNLPETKNTLKSLLNNIPFNIPFNVLKEIGNQLTLTFTEKQSLKPEGNKAKPYDIKVEAPKLRDTNKDYTNALTGALTNTNNVINNLEVLEIAKQKQKELQTQPPQAV